MQIPHDSLARFARRWRIARISLFGSFARGEEHDGSDVDILVRFEEDERWDLFDLGQMLVETEELFGRPVDLVEEGTIRNPIRRATIDRDLTVLYAA